MKVNNFILETALLSSEFYPIIQLYQKHRREYFALLAVFLSNIIGIID